MSSEILKRNARISELKNVVHKIQCACEEAEVHATNAYLINPTPVCTRYSFEDTVSEYELALSHLQEKCKQKDRMIAVMVQELRSSANERVYDQMLQTLAMSPSTDRDFNRTEICNFLRRPSSDLYSGRSIRNAKGPRQSDSVGLPNYASRQSSSRNSQIVEQFSNVRRVSSRGRNVSKSLQTSNVRLHGPIISPHPGYRSCSCGDVDDEYALTESDDNSNVACKETDFSNYSCEAKCLNKTLQIPDTLAKDVAVCSHPNFPNCACYQSTEISMVKNLPGCLDTDFSDCKGVQPSLKEVRDVSTECSHEYKDSSETILKVLINDVSKECVAECRREFNCEDTSVLSAKEGNPIGEVAKTRPLCETASVSRDSTGPCGDVQSKRSLKKVVNIARDSTEESQGLQEASSRLEDSSVCLHPNYPNCPCESNEDLPQNPGVCLNPNYPNCPCDSNENVRLNSLDAIKESANSCETPSETMPCTSVSNLNCLTSCESNPSDKKIPDNSDVWKVSSFIEDSQSKISIKRHEEPVDSYETPIGSFSTSHEHPELPEEPILQHSLCVPGCSSNPERCENYNFPNCPCSGKNAPISHSQVPERELVLKTHSPAVIPEASSSPRRSTLLASGSSNYPTHSPAVIPEASSSSRRSTLLGGGSSDYPTHSPAVIPEASPSPRRSTLLASGSSTYQLFGWRKKQKSLPQPALSSGRVRTHSTNRAIKDAISFSPLTEQSSSRKFSQKSLCTTGCSSNPDKCEHSNFPDCPCSGRHKNISVDVSKRFSLQDPVTFSPSERPQQGDASLRKRSSLYRSSRVSIISKKSSIPGPIHKYECCKSTQEKKDGQVRRPSKNMEGMCNCKCPSVCPIHGGDESEIIPNKCPQLFDTGSPIKITEVRRLSPDGLIIKWSTRNCECFKGYEVEIDGVIKSRVYSPRRTSTVLHALTLTNSVEILVYAIAPDGRYGLPAKAVF